MKIYIICNSKTGFTRRYADWIAEETGAVVIPYKKYDKTVINTEDAVIFGSHLHAGRIEYLDKIKARFKSHKKFAVFAAGGTPGASAESIEKVWNTNFTTEELVLIPHFYMQGGINYEKMGFLDRMLMKTVAKMMSKQRHLSAADAGFAEAIQNSYDISSREYIRPLVDYIAGK
ncbi:MAG TPA: hypothetical protein DEQ14_07565 [Treponema sp.]|nr:hypothetical protein [Treponema sp.]